MTDLTRRSGLRWLPERSRFRDYTPAKAQSPATADLTARCFEIGDRGDIGSFTADASVGVVASQRRRRWNRSTSC